MYPMIRRALLACVMAGLLCAGAMAAEPRTLLDLSGGVEALKARLNGAEIEGVETDGAAALQVKVGHQEGGWPGVELPAPAGGWDLSAYGALEIELVNTGEVGVRVHGRVDNPGDWRAKPWSVNAVNLKPGAAQTLRVPFGRSYGNPGYALDPAKISQIVVFADKPKAPATFQVRAIRAIDAPAPAAAAPAGSGDDTPAVAPASSTLYDFAGDFDAGRLVDNATEHQVVDADGGRKALRIRFTEGGGYPGVQLNGPAGGWDLRDRAGIEVDVTNPGEKTVVVALRADNPGDWKKQPWNYEKTALKPGQSATIRVQFGKTGGAPGFALNPAKVVRGLVYAERPPQGAEILVTGLRSWGQAVIREVDTVDLEGKLFEFGPDFVLAGRVAGTGATASVSDGKLIVNYSTDEKWPAVALRPVAKRWDLSNFESVQVDLANTGDAAVRVGMRVDNPGAPKNSNTEIATLAPGESKTLKVTFGQSWGQAAYALDPAEVTSLLLFAEGLKAPATIAVSGVKANRKQWAEVPDWVGTRPPVEGDWVQTLAEEFDGPKLDESRWNRRLVWGGPHPAEIQRYIEENVVIEDGAMVIKCEKNPGHQYNEPERPRREYATGIATTFDKWTQCYGYFEARIKSPTARGLWPAFWMMPDRGEGNGDVWQRRSTSNNGMEIDIWEHLTEWGPHRYNIAAHWDGYDANHKVWGNSHVYKLPTEDGWHTYGLLWEPGKLSWYCDGRKVAEWANDRIASVPVYLKFCVQMGNWATKDVDDAALPDKLQVDYVRAWQLRERVTK